MADQLATTADLANLLQVDPGDLNTAAATLLLEAATATVQAAVGQRIVQVVNDTITIDLDEHDTGPYLTLPQRPVTAVGAVLVGGVAVTGFTAQLGRGRLYRTGGWRAAQFGDTVTPSQVTVTYTHGYPPGDQRLQLARTAVLSLAAGVYYSPAGGVVREAIDDYQVQYEATSGQMTVDTALAGLLRRTYGGPPSSVRLVRS